MNIYEERIHSGWLHFFSIYPCPSIFFCISVWKSACRYSVDILFTSWCTHVGAPNTDSCAGLVVVHCKMKELKISQRCCWITRVHEPTMRASCNGYPPSTPLFAWLWFSIHAHLYNPFHFLNSHFPLFRTLIPSAALSLISFLRFSIAVYIVPPFPLAFTYFPFAIFHSGCVYRYHGTVPPVIPGDSCGLCLSLLIKVACE